MVRGNSATEPSLGTSDGLFMSFLLAPFLVARIPICTDMQQLAGVMRVCFQIDLTPAPHIFFPRLSRRESTEQNAKEGRRRRFAQVCPRSSILVGV